jgi:hypothetical protein
MSKRIDQLTAATDAQATNDTWLWLIGDPASGQLYKVTRAQLTAAFGVVQSVKYVATGSEGSTLTIAALASKTILSIAREGGTIYEVTTSPDSEEFTFNSTDITLGRAITGAGERFLILYA